jgi:hypothetical protein
MKMRTRRRLRFGMKCARSVLCCAAMLACGAMAARGTTLMRMSLEQLSQTAQVIVRAECVGSTAEWRGGEIWTVTSFRVEETWRGAAGGSPIQVRLIGGRAGNLTSSVSGVPRFRAGEDVVLFLEKTSRGEFTVVSWEQGTFRIARAGAAASETVTQDTASFATFDPATRRFEEAGIRRLALASFRARVDAALRVSSGSRP